ncbi:hypothetical protein [Candidatus Nitrospira allomarina]|jgi:hypothetical protein|uniref:Uncharacterized protein n=1 Tax=Candidatus Nitrospira allomarina TaxID=3020900 RepID=A0AA96GDT0_9BACT|nr:hypothetical protein [Candidatus Nitrospira allomarina]WNM59257.1 hypothetical protein PP769_05690 [Candidatus Nitrospira allomarina]
MNDHLWHQLNAVLGSLTVTVGLWLLVGALSVPLGVALAIGLAILLAWKSPSIGSIWAISTLLLGVESLAWPIMQMADLQKLGPEPPLEELERIFTAVLFGLFSGVFWMTFAYGIFKRTREKNTPTSPSTTLPKTKNQKKQSRRRSG